MHNIARNIVLIILTISHVHSNVNDIIDICYNEDTNTNKPAPDVAPFVVLLDGAARPET